MAPGARRALGIARVILMAASMAVPAASAARDDALTGPLPWRVAGRVGFTVDAAAFPDSTGETVEVYVRIPPATIAGLTRDETGEGKLKLQARLRPGAGKARPIEQEIVFGAADSASGYGKVVILRVPARPGSHRLYVRLEDIRSQKRGIAYIGRRVTEAAEIDGPLVVAVAQGGRKLSNIEFVWEDRLSAQSSPFHHAGHRVIPNPERLYGKYATHLQAFFVAQGVAGDVRPWHWIARATEPEGRGLWEQQGHAAADDWLHANCQMDLDFPAGGYDLELEVWQEGDTARMSRSARFSVAWSPETWFRNPGEVEDRVHFLLNSDGAERFRLMHPGEQERFLAEYWSLRDPTPGTERNEARQTFDERVEDANRRFTRSGIGLGMFSDMGRTFIRYGEPSEKFDQVIPTGDDTVAEVLERIRYTDDRVIGDVQQKGLGGDLRSFEVWIYEGEIPLPPDVVPDERRSAHRRRLTFLFVDERGVGDYRLRYASE